MFDKLLLTHSFALAGRILRCNLPLGGLTPAPGSSPPDISIRFAGPRSPSDASQVVWFHRWKDPGSEEDPWLHFGRHEKGYLLRFPRYADFDVGFDGQLIRCLPYPATPDDTLHHLLLDQVLPLALSLLGDVVLHASAVEVDGAAIAFAGESGFGKSTLAATFAKSGAALLADDCLTARECKGEWLAWPYYRGVRLWPAGAEQFADDSLEPQVAAHYTRKLRVGARERWAFAGGGRPLRALFFLADPGQPSGEIGIRRLSPINAVMALVKTSFILDVCRAETLRQHFTAIGPLATSLACYEFAYPRSFDRLDEVRSAVINHCRRGDSD